jgi:ribosomal protein S18 acetylase RimI-like enzyme
MIKYEKLSPVKISKTDVSMINRLLSQLTGSSREIDLWRARDLATTSRWIVARDEDGSIRGMGSLTVSHIPTGIVGHLDDIVVDDSLRGRGIGEEIVKRLIGKIKMRNKVSVDRIELTCRPSRISANKLYQKLGFYQRETNCYILKF